MSYTLSLEFMVFFSFFQSQLQLHQDQVQAERIYTFALDSIKFISNALQTSIG